ncbi:phosphosulfolactate synthase [Coxiella burnetii]|uniref:phosphosulfolactate synthase n=1 Tax=Coxiella burnetii TaxID=777 RepID=UPI0000DAE1E2|nr:phosphosulfolactate synthase [Coxiella burnetii]OYK80694.1 hypothetical protein CbuD7E6568_03070 [Coxiella burnetii]
MEKPLAFDFISLPQRAPKPRQEGLTSVIDKGLSLQETEALLDRGGGFYRYPQTRIWHEPNLFQEKIIAEIKFA